jgi:hypothetical protein
VESDASDLPGDLKSPGRNFRVIDVVLMGRTSSCQSQCQYYRYLLVTEIRDDNFKTKYYVPYKKPIDIIIMDSYKALSCGVYLTKSWGVGGATSPVALLMVLSRHCSNCKSGDNNADCGSQNSNCSTHSSSCSSRDTNGISHCLKFD